MFSQEVLSVLAQGVGLDANDLLKDLPSSDERFFAHQKTQALRHKFMPQSSSEDNSLWTASFSESQKSFIERFALKLLDSAGKSLPETIKWFSNKETKKETISFNSLASKWRQGSEHVQHEVGRALATALHPMKDANGKDVDFRSGSDSYDQPRERVLPALYGKWDPELGANNRPNCLGKFQLLIAFGHLVNAEMLALTPLIYGSSSMSGYRVKACRMIYDLVQELPIKVSEKRQKSLFNVIKQMWINNSLPELQHFAVLYRMKDSKWLLIDPNLGLSTVMKNTAEIDEIRSELFDLQEQAPGASVLLRDDKELSKYQHFVDIVEKNCAKVSEIKQQIAEANDWPSLKALLFESGIANEMLGWDSFFDITDRDKSKRFDKVALFLYNQAYEVKKKVKKDEQSEEEQEKEVKAEKIEKKYYFIAETDFEKLRETLVYRYLQYGDVEITGLYRHLKVYGQAVHPLYELSLPEFRVATATISHTAYDLSLELGRETEEILFAFGIAEGHLFNVALGGDGFTADNPELALKLLKLQACHGKLAQRLL